MKKEIYEDVSKDEPKDIESDEYKDWEKRLHKSIGFIMPEEHHEVLLEDSKRGNDFGNIKLASSSLNSEIRWDVSLGNDAGFTCKDDEHAVILSAVLQINERLKRIEEKINNGS